MTHPPDLDADADADADADCLEADLSVWQEVASVRSDDGSTDCEQARPDDLTTSHSSTGLPLENPSNAHSTVTPVKVDLFVDDSPVVLPQEISAKEILRPMYKRGLVKVALLVGVSLVTIFLTLSWSLARNTNIVSRMVLNRDSLVGMPPSDSIVEDSAEHSGASIARLSTAALSQESSVGSQRDDRERATCDASSDPQTVAPRNRATQVAPLFTDVCQAAETAQIAHVAEIAISAEIEIAQAIKTFEVSEFVPVVEIDEVEAAVPGQISDELPVQIQNLCVDYKCSSADLGDTSVVTPQDARAPAVSTNDTAPTIDPRWIAAVSVVATLAMLKFARRGQQAATTEPPVSDQTSEAGPREGDLQHRAGEEAGRTHISHDQRTPPATPARHMYDLRSASPANHHYDLRSARKAAQRLFE